MNSLGFRLEEDATGRCWWKVYDDDGRGYAVGDEVKLWQALQAAEARVAELERQEHNYELQISHLVADLAAEATSGIAAGPAAAERKGRQR